MIVFISLICNYMVLGKAAINWFPFLCLFTAIMPLMLAIMIKCMPVESLPHVEHWPANRLDKNRFGFSLIMIVSCLLVAALFPSVYCLAALLTNQLIWPINHDLFLTVMPFTLILGLLPGYLDVWNRRQRRRQFRRWICGSTA